VQSVIEKTLATYLQHSISLTGCGRTDTGVHARDFYAHFDVDVELKEIPTLIYRINKMLPPDISVHAVISVHDTAHARFDALSRSYEYHLHTTKSPFLINSYYYPYGMTDLDLLNETASLIKKYSDFTTFCKTKTDVKTMNCKIAESFWTQHQDQFVYRITADRFLRGMIRLIVGMSLNVASGKLSLSDVSKAIDAKKRTGHDLSVPAHGLFLCDIKYPYPTY
jgi:tRNA pseudouridine38-40 synthase